MKKWEAFILTISLITWIACNNLWVYTDAPIYYFGIAQVIFVSSIIIYLRPKQYKFQSFISRVFLFVSANNLVDELFFNPQAFEINEYVSFIGFVIYSTWITYKK